MSSLRCCPWDYNFNMSDLFISFLAFPCSENFSYQPCIAACEVPESCQNNEVTSLDSDSCSVLTEGCVCAGGTILHRTHTAVCIPEEKCGIFGCDFFLYYLQVGGQILHYSQVESWFGVVWVLSMSLIRGFWYSVNMNSAGEQVRNVLVMHNFAHFISAGRCSLKSLLEFIYSITVSVSVLASFSPKPFAKGATFWDPMVFKWHTATVNYTFWIICVCPASIHVYFHCNSASVHQIMDQFFSLTTWTLKMQFMINQTTKAQ